MRVGEASLVPPARLAGMIEARELCRAGGALVAAARDEGTAAELEAKFAAPADTDHVLPFGRALLLLQFAQLRARFEEQGLWGGWTSGGACMLTWALETLPEDLWARGVLCPAERAVTLAATSKRGQGGWRGCP